MRTVNENQHVWVLYAYDDPDEAPIYETFELEDGPPGIEKLRRDWPEGSALYRYRVLGDVAVSEYLVGLL